MNIRHELSNRMALSDSEIENRELATVPSKLKLAMMFVEILIVRLEGAKAGNSCKVYGL
jgi:hypothetical protein